MSETWIKLYRKAMEHPVFCDESAWRVWTWILMSVDYETGEMTFGRFKDADALSISPSKFRHIIDRLRSKYDLIETTNQHSHTKLKVKNWHKYQGQPDSIVDNSQTRPELGPQIRPQDDSHVRPQGETEEILQQRQNDDAILETGPHKRPQGTTDLGPQTGATQKATIQEYKNNKENKNNIYISNVESEKPKERRAPKKSGMDTSRDEEIFDILHHFNKERGKHYKSIEDVRSNALKRLTIYTIEEVKLAISNIQYDEWWKDKDMDWTTLFRFTDRYGNSVDYIGKFLNTRTKPAPTGSKKLNATTAYLAGKSPLEFDQTEEVYGQTVSIF